MFKPLGVFILIEIFSLQPLLALAPHTELSPGFPMFSLQQLDSPMVPSVAFDKAKYRSNVQGLLRAMWQDILEYKKQFFYVRNAFFCERIAQEISRAASAQELNTDEWWEDIQNAASILGKEEDRDLFVFQAWSWVTQAAYAIGHKRPFRPSQNVVRDAAAFLEECVLCDEGYRVHQKVSCLANAHDLKPCPDCSAYVKRSGVLKQLCGGFLKKGTEENQGRKIIFQWCQALFEREKNPLLILDFLPEYGIPLWVNVMDWALETYENLFQEGNNVQEQRTLEDVLRGLFNMCPALSGEDWAQTYDSLKQNASSLIVCKAFIYRCASGIYKTNTASLSNKSVKSLLPFPDASEKIGPLPFSSLMFAFLSLACLDNNSLVSCLPEIYKLNEMGRPSQEILNSRFLPSLKMKVSIQKKSAATVVASQSVEAFSFKQDCENHPRDLRYWCNYFRGICADSVLSRKDKEQRLWQLANDLCAKGPQDRRADLLVKEIWDYIFEHFYKPADNAEIKIVLYSLFIQEVQRCLAAFYQNRPFLLIYSFNAIQTWYASGDSSCIPNLQGFLQEWIGFCTSSLESNPKSEDRDTLHFYQILMNVISLAAELAPQGGVSMIYKKYIDEALKKFPEDGLINQQWLSQGCFMDDIIRENCTTRLPLGDTRAFYQYWRACEGRVSLRKKFLSRYFVPFYYLVLSDDNAQKMEEILQWWSVYDSEQCLQGIEQAIKSYPSAKEDLSFWRLKTLWEVKKQNSLDIEQEAALIYKDVVKIMPLERMEGWSFLQLTLYADLCVVLKKEQDLISCLRKKIFWTQEEFSFLVRLAEIIPACNEVIKKFVSANDAKKNLKEGSVEQHATAYMASLNKTPKKQTQMVVPWPVVEWWNFDSVYPVCDKFMSEEKKKDIQQKLEEELLSPSFPPSLMERAYDRLWLYDKKAFCKGLCDRFTSIRSREPVESLVSWVVKDINRFGDLFLPFVRNVVKILQFERTGELKYSEDHSIETEDKDRRQTLRTYLSLKKALRHHGAFEQAGLVQQIHQEAYPAYIDQDRNMPDFMVDGEKVTGDLPFSEEEFLKQQAFQERIVAVMQMERSNNEAAWQKEFLKPFYHLNPDKVLKDNVEKEITSQTSESRSLREILKKRRTCQDDATQWLRKKLLESLTSKTDALSGIADAELFFKHLAANFKWEELQLSVEKFLNLCGMKNFAEALPFDGSLWGSIFLLKALAEKKCGQTDAGEKTFQEALLYKPENYDQLLYWVEYTTPSNDLGNVSDQNLDFALALLKQDLSGLGLNAEKQTWYQKLCQEKMKRLLSQNNISAAEIFLEERQENVQQDPQLKTTIVQIGNSYYSHLYEKRETIEKKFLEKAVGQDFKDSAWWCVVVAWCLVEAQADANGEQRKRLLELLNNPAVKDCVETTQAAYAIKLCLWVKMENLQSLQQYFSLWEKDVPKDVADSVKECLTKLQGKKAAEKAAKEEQEKLQQEKTKADLKAAKEEQERQKQEESLARQKAEEEKKDRQRQAEKNKKETDRKAKEAAARQKAERERQRQEALAAQKAKEEREAQERLRLEELKRQEVLQRQEEERRAKQLAEQQRLAEEERQRQWDWVAKQAQKEREEQERLRLEELKRQETLKRQEEERRAKQLAEQQRLAQEERQRQEALAAQKAKEKREAHERLRLEELKRQEELQRQRDEEFRRQMEQQRKIEEERRAKQLAEQQRLAEEERRIQEERLAEEKRQYQEEQEFEANLTVQEARRLKEQVNNAKGVLDKAKGAGAFIEHMNKKKLLFSLQSYKGKKFYFCELGDMYVELGQMKEACTTYREGLEMQGMNSDLDLLSRLICMPSFGDARLDDGEKARYIATAEIAYQAIRVKTQHVEELMQKIREMGGQMLHRAPQDQTPPQVPGQSRILCTEQFHVRFSPAYDQKTRWKIG